MQVREKLLAHRIVARSVQALLRSAHRGRRRGPARPGPVRIVLSNAYGAGGTMRTVLNLAHRLAQRHELEIVSLVRHADRPFYPFPAGCRVRVLEDRRPGIRRHLAERLLTRLPSALMHLDDIGYRNCTLWTDIQLLRLVRGLRSGVLITTRPAFNVFVARFAPPDVVAVGQEHMNIGALAGDLPAEIGRQYRELDAVAVLTASDEREYRRRLGFSTRVVRIPNAVPDVPGEPAQERDTVILAAGRLVRQKGFDLLLRAFAPVARARPEWRLVIRGEGARADELADLVDELGLADRVELAGATQRLGEEMARAAIYALSSRYEGFPMVLLEAMSKSMAVVSFDCPTGPREIITPGADGLLVPPEDVEGLSRALLLLTENEALRRRMGDEASRTARKYDMRVVGARWERLLAELGAPLPDVAAAPRARERIESA